MDILKELDATDIIALYAALISTITLVWAIIDVVLEKKSRLKVHIGISGAFEFIPGVGSGPIKHTIAVKITNKSEYDMYINKPIIKLPEKVDGQDERRQTLLDNMITYPQTIKPREQYSVEIKLSEQLVGLLKKCKKQNGKLKIIVEDTLGKRFCSNKITIKQLVVYGEVEMNKDKR